MLPCCALGALFFIQLMAFTRWFKRVILRKKPEEDEQDYWVPDSKSVKGPFKLLFADKRKRTIAFLALAIEVLIAIAAVAAWNHFTRSCH